MAVVGILGQEALGASPAWFEAGAKDYGVPIAGLLAIEFLVLGHFELKRFQGWNKYKTVRGRAAEHLGP
jgi:light-harvesting complex I chlorophyll a/b binding protein 5